ncbi:tetraacyldisaccharide 4'-kinase [Thiolapillus brandeum]|uniref:tetraacyldisaccharide 4'-kinase n=1 Tax=Thiolapillus brandeum TaxID=1076588 RepID=UPI0005976640|nr:tetraacyldisaccharide 4'-kinase [Thiolapillus brandeum]
MNSLWYGNNPLAWLLLPFSLLFWALSSFRRMLYYFHLKKIHHFSVPVVVVGNISVGGTGKSPLVVWMCDHLEQLGYKPGIVARGYGGKASHWPQQVRPDSDPVMAGDEAVMLARLTGRPVCVGPDRPAAVQELLAYTDCDIVVSDDGLQHYAMGRDVEIAVVDGERGLGNEFLLPAGPLRELPGRLRSVDLVISTGSWWDSIPIMKIDDPVALPLLDLEADPQPLAQASGEKVHAVAGIGNPRRFFTLLEQCGLEIIPHAFPDHYQYRREDMQFDDELPVLMTEKDAVKYARFATERHWLVRIAVIPDESFVKKFDELLQDLKHGQEAA